MSIVLLEAVLIAGTSTPVGTPLTLDAGMEAALVSANKARYATAPAPGSGPSELAQHAAEHSAMGNFVTAETNLTGGIEVSYVVAGRSAVQLATTPTAADIAFGDAAVFYDIATPTRRYSMNAAHTAFVPTSSVSVIAQSAVAASVTGTTAETTLASIAVPAMGPKDSLRVTLQWSFTGSTNLKTMVAKLNNGTFATTSTNTAANLIAKQEVTVMNRNATNVQLGSMFGFGMSSATSGSFLSPSVETSGVNTILIRGQLALGSETLTLEAYIVELIRG